MAAAGREWSWSYFDHPPLSWWLSAGAAALFGSEAAIVLRLPFIALFALTTWLVFAWTREMFGERAGLWAAGTLNMAPVLGLTTGSWVLPDGPLLPALLGFGWALHRAMLRDQW
ncbi:MAG: glycosyltransferase family 39 protein, partial [Rubrivivax sp.]|nr:glycosyltransferase family 39 protein [Rubrivivax sp.]